MSKTRKRSLTQWFVLITVAALSGIAASSIGGVFAQESPPPPSEPAPDPGSVDACTLLTEAEASAALGAPVTTVDDSGQCTFVADDGSGRSVGVAVPTGMPSSEHFAAGMEQLASAVSGDLRVVASGDEGYVVTSDHFSEGIARVGEAFVAVVLTGPRADADTQANTITDLMNTALSRR